MEYPLFESLTLHPATQAPTLATEAAQSDVTGFVGNDIDAATWAALQARVAVKGWTVEAVPVGEKWHVRRIKAQP